MSRTSEGMLTLLMRRTVKAPRDRVFEAFTEPKHLLEWWGPVGCTCPVANVDLRVGGDYRLGISTPDGNVYHVHGTYREVTAPSRLVYTWNWDKTDHAAVEGLGETLVTLDFEDRGDATEIVVKHELFPNVEFRDKHAQGWEGCLTSLANLIE